MLHSAVNMQSPTGYKCTYCMLMTRAVAISIAGISVLQFSSCLHPVCFLAITKFDQFIV